MSDTTAPILSGDTLKKAQQRELERVTQNIIGLLLGIFSAAIWVFTGASSALRDALGGDTNVWYCLLWCLY